MLECRTTARGHSDYGRSLRFAGSRQCSRPCLVGLILICSVGQLLGEEEQEDEEDAPTEDPDGTTQSTKHPTTWRAETEQENPALSRTTQHASAEADEKTMKQYELMQATWRAPIVHEDPFKVEFHFEKLDPPSIDDPLNTTGFLTIQVVPRWAYRAAHRFRELIETGFLENTYLYDVDGGYIEFGEHGGTPQQKHWDDRPIGIDPPPIDFDDVAATALRRGVLTFGDVNFMRKTKMVLFQKDLAESGDTQLRPFAKVIHGFDILDRVHATGKHPPEGTGPNLDKVEEQGDGYLKANFPDMTILKHAVILGTTSTTTTDDVQWANPIIECETTKGNLLLEMHSEWSQAHVTHFMELVRAGYYNNNAFHHVVRDGYIKFGISPNKDLRDDWQGIAIPEEYIQHRQSKGDTHRCEQGHIAFTGPRGGKTTQVIIPLETDFEGCEFETFTPFGIVKAVESGDTLAHINGEYGVVPDVAQMIRDGQQYLNKFGRLDKILTCEIANDKAEWGMGAEYIKPEEPYDLTLGPRGVFFIVFGICAMAIGLGFFCVMSGAMKENGDEEEIYKKV
mmetsp:Transcript_149455/g.260703  ORF Transcript_149455/g.260703 Transcript_149455/m.260703 type:complete len:565 (+) Transcript_149455:69-1763(+)